MHQLQKILSILFLFYTSLFVMQLNETDRISKPESRGGILIYDKTIYAADHHDGLWKSDTGLATYGQTTGRDKALSDLWREGDTLVGVGVDGLFSMI